MTATTVNVRGPFGKRGGLSIVQRVAQSSIRNEEDGSSTTSVTLQGRTVRVRRAKRAKVYQVA